MQKCLNIKYLSVWWGTEKIPDLIFRQCALQLRFAHVSINGCCFDGDRFKNKTNRADLFYGAVKKWVYSLPVLLQHRHLLRSHLIVSWELRPLAPPPYGLQTLLIKSSTWHSQNIIQTYCVWYSPAFLTVESVWRIIIANSFFSHYRSFRRKVRCSRDSLRKNLPIFHLTPAGRIVSWHH